MIPKKNLFGFENIKIEIRGLFEFYLDKKQINIRKV